MQIISDMLKQNTGSHFLDSGGDPQYDTNGNYIGSKYGYGRNYERHQKVDFDKTPVFTLTLNPFEFNYNIYHYLTERLSYAPDLNDILKEFLESENDILDFPEFFGEFGAVFQEEVNTYNHQNFLSQTIQYQMFEYNRKEYCILQTHNGADVRGGYSDPKIFLVHEYIDGTFATLTCGNHSWSTDDGGYRWYTNDDANNLESYEESPTWKQGFLTPKDNTVLCPLCGDELTL